MYLRVVALGKLRITALEEGVGVRAGRNSAFRRMMGRWIEAQAFKGIAVCIQDGSFQEKYYFVIHTHQTMTSSRTFQLKVCNKDCVKTKNILAFNQIVCGSFKVCLCAVFCAGEMIFFLLLSLL